MSLKDQAHRAYMAWIAEAGPQFSPFWPLREPIEVGGFTFWTVESLWLGSQIFKLRELSQVAPEIEPFVVGEEEGWQLCMFPQVGELRMPAVVLKKHIVMRMLRRCPSYNGKRNRLLGRENWELDTRFYNLAAQRILPAERFHTEMVEPFYPILLRQYPECMATLRDLQAGGWAPITEQIKGEHGHLGVLETMLSEQ